MTENVWLAVIVAIPTLVGVLVPVLLRMLDLREAAAKEIRDNDRRDRVEITLKNNTEAVAATAQVASDKLDDIQSGQRDIHALVNSNLTAAKQAELSATEAKVSLLREIVSLRGKEASRETVAEIDITSARAAELTAELADRLKIEKAK